MTVLPSELLDHIVDLLHDSHIPLRNCCLVSKSWISRTRRHLFAKIDFPTAKRLESWKKTFSDPSTSPACYTNVLSINGPEVVAAAGVEAGSWIGSFSRVVRLEMVSQNPFAEGWEEACVLFRGFSPAIKSFRTDFPYLPSQIFDLILSFPLLEDLDVVGCFHVSVEHDGRSNGLPTVTQPSSLPLFVGSLYLDMKGGMGPIVNWLLSLPNGIHFRKLTSKWFREGDTPLTVALMEKCSRTLESLDVTEDPRGTSIGYLRPHRSKPVF